MAHVLVVEPDEAYRRLIGSLLEVMGHSWGATCGGEAAAALLATEPFEVVLTEWHLPDRDGLWLLEQIAAARHHGRRVVGVVLTAAATREQVVCAINAGVAGFLLKSQLDARRLGAAIASALSFGRDRWRQEEVKPFEHTGSVHIGRLVPYGTRRTAARVEPEAVAESQGAACATSLRDLRPLMTRAAVLDRLKEIEQLKAMSPTVTQIIDLTASKTTSLSAVAKVINRDQSVALKVLRMANSSIHDRGDPVTTVQEAVVRLGMLPIRELVMNIGLMDKFNTSVASRHFNFMHFWEHSIACGMIAAALSEFVQGVDRDRAFTLGLLHDVGRMVLVEHFQEEYAQVFEAAFRLSLPLEQVESRLLLLNHADIMDRLLHMWGFPPDLVTPVANHHLSASNLREHVTKQLPETALLALADRLTHSAMLGSSGNETLYPTEPHCRLLGLEGVQVRGAVERAVEETHKVKYSLLAVAEHQSWPAAIDRHLSGIEQPVRPLYVTLDEGIDAYERVFEGLSDGQEEVNVSVVRLLRAKYAPAVAEKLRAAEERVGVGKVPLIVLSPTGELELSGEVVAGRELYRLPTPVTVERLTHTLNHALREPDAECQRASTQAA